MSGMEMVMIGTMIASTAMTAYGQIQAGNNAEEMAALEKQRMEHEALQMDIKANEELAEGQSEAQEYRRKKELAISTATARGAASGFSATDGNTLDIIQGLEEQGEMQAGMAMYGGQSRAEGYKGAAAGRRFSGDMAIMGGERQKQASRINAGSTVLSGISKGTQFGMKQGWGQTSSPGVNVGPGAYIPHG